MNTKTVITNGQITIAIDTAATKAANYRKAVEQGYTGDSTGFNRLLNGKKAMVKGFKLEVIEIKKPKAIEINKPKAISGFNSVEALEALNISDMVVKVPAVRQTYGSLVVNNGRLQITPIKNGTFGLLFYPSKGKSATDVLNELGLEFKEGAKYTTIQRVDLETLNKVVASL